MMNAIEVSTPGPPDVLRLVSRPDPDPGPGEVCIDVHAAGVNRPDLMQRQGSYPPPAGVTDIPGLEIAGVIAALGSDAPASASGRVWRVGDVVCALVAGGGYAERCVVPGVQCLAVPAGLSMTQAAAIPETYFTVWTNVFERGRLVADEWLLVHGGTSGIGTTAIQLATARGARVIATAGSDEKARACEAIGAVRAINYRTTDFVAAVKDATSDRGVDVILDLVGASYLQRNLDCLARDGRLVTIGHMGGGPTTAEFALRQVMLRRLTITGSTLRARTPREKGYIAAALEREVWPSLEAGQVRPIIAATFPLADAAAAHAALDAGDLIGKVVLTAR